MRTHPRLLPTVERGCARVNAGKIARACECLAKAEYKHAFAAPKETKICSYKIEVVFASGLDGCATKMRNSEAPAHLNTSLR